MRDFSLPPLVEPLRSGGLADSVHRIAEDDPKLVQLSRRSATGDGAWEPVTAAEFRDEVLGLARGLLSEGIGFGDRVAVMSRTRYEWTLFGCALWSIGAQIVPVYPTSSAEQVRWILSDARVVAVVVEHEDHAMTIGAVCNALPLLRRMWQLDSGCVELLTNLGHCVPVELVHRMRAAVRPWSVATVTYTSGTTGRPKGCVITHANLVAECDTLYEGWRELLAEKGEQPAVLAFLPLSHIYGLMVVVVCLRHGVRLGHQPDLAPAELLPALASFRPTYLFAVPYVFERIVAAARRAAEEAGRGELFQRAADVAVRYGEAVERRYTTGGPGPGPMLRAAHAVFDRMVYTRLRAVLGGRVRFASSGGSTLSRELGLLFAGAGIIVHDGYGLTETTAAVTGQPAGRPRFGTVGLPLPGCAVHIARDGEIWVRGEVVFSGYLDDPVATAAVLRDGWLATGDIGYLDDDGHLVITGRKKDVLITSGGKSVSPLLLEERLRAHPLVSQCLVVGDNRPYIAALVTLDPDALESRRSLGRVVGRAETAGDGRRPGADDVQAEVRRAVAMANSAVSRAESIRAFRILPSEFSMEEGLMTPSMKLRRGAIVQAFAADIEDLYRA
ncbi:AMP-dependent synthetase/ligase [Streptomyces sp. 549]|uniref:AMP-dependent synthetase/ligase n=1 Tax=Streptomyces sp. 549 TaxID=3049076 RepID=UPI0024C34619|nr:AMP-dependent synthetase/ligase [Streptomyces sp. 549]MDK1474017.1 AMP-dependent synthetase/ligase [Streptomyces sp. 549]